MPDASFYREGLARVLASGQAVPAVLDPLSTASDFGRKRRPWREVIGHCFTFANTRPFLFFSPHLPIHVPYCFGLLAWTLAGRQDVDLLAYYRPGARQYSDDGMTLCGAFGARLFGLNHGADQVAAIVERLRLDPASRRTYATIARPEDNLQESREYPCAAGVQLFLRNDVLDMMTVMRAQQALTVLPYDVFLFSSLHHFIASDLGVRTGAYHHQAGTFHVYEDEIALAERVRDSALTVIDLPPPGPSRSGSASLELTSVEEQLRHAAKTGDTTAVERLAKQPLQHDFSITARHHLVDFARRKIERG